MLRPCDLGTTQWNVLYQLAHDGPTMQRDLVKALQVERATLSVIISVLVRKGLVEQTPDRVDQRQKWLRLTAAGSKLWKTLPDRLSFTTWRSTAWMTRPSPRRSRFSKPLPDDLKSSWTGADTWQS